MRAPLKFQAGLADVFIVNSGRGTDAVKSEIEHLAGEPLTKPWLGMRMTAEGDTSWLKDTRVFAYAGIGNPSRFFDSLTELGATLTGMATFRDHQIPTAADANELIRAARARTAVLVTTEKDFVRLPPTGPERLMELKA